jgi:NADH-quinone oxidoreductase subunit F
MLDGTQLKLNKDGFIEIDPTTGQTSIPGIYSGGDAVLGPASVVEAISAGERAAISIDTQFTGVNHAFWRVQKNVDTAFDPNDDPAQYSRAKMQLLPVKKRKNNFQEVELPWSDTVAVREAKRCLRCDYRQKCEA